MSQYNPAQRFVVEQEPDGFGWNVIDMKHNKHLATFCTKEQAFHRAKHA